MMTDVELFRAVGVALHGEEFHAKLADDLGNGLRTVQRWGTGAVPIPPGVWPELHTLLSGHCIRIAALASQISARVSA
jgi:hypothetical protein